MPDKAFLDTNILVYAFAAGDPRQGTALDLLLAGGVVGVQTLNEFVSVLAGKLKTPWAETLARLETVEQLCTVPVALTLSVHRRGLKIAQAHGFRFYDSLMLAAALEASCSVFYSEDLQDGKLVEGLRIRNPFARTM